MGTDECYMCSSPSTSREHVPPKCIFPEKGFSIRDYRKNLITVPSCDAHNSRKSEDDEFLRFLLVIQRNANLAGKRVFHEKVRPAVRRSKKKYAEMVVDDFPWRSGTQDFHVARIDRRRVDKCFDQLTRAIFFNELGTKLSHSIQFAFPDLRVDSGSGKVELHDPTERLFNAVRQYLDQGANFLGKNQKIFKYRYKWDESEELFCLEMDFYQGFRVAAASGGVRRQDFGVV